MTTSERHLSDDAIEDIINKLKQNNYANSGFPRPLVWQDRVVGYIRPIVHSDVAEDRIITLLQTWRSRNRTAFFTQFEPTIESTRRWLREIILADVTRILFLVSDDSGRPIGQCGACNIVRKEAELDAVMRGERVGHGFLMTLAERTLFKWLFDELKINKLYARIFADNVTSMRLFLGLGMRVESWRTFQRHSEGGIIRYSPAINDTAEAGIRVAYLVMDRGY